MHKFLAKINLKILFTLFSFSLFAQENIKIYHETTSNGYAIYADNLEYCPISIELDLELTNMVSKDGKNTLFVVNSLQKKTLLTQISTVKKNMPSKFNYSYTSNLGDSKQHIPQENFDYFLPFETNSSFTIYQGYNGSFSHKNENSLDFTMPVGTPITAIREGVVVKLVESNNIACPEKECVKHNNYVIIYHPDGTFAEYTHLKKMGVEVNVGDKVTQGQLIGYSGNTGWSTGAHLHLMVYLQRLKNRETLKTKFKIGDGSKSEYLEEKINYSRNY